MAIPPKPVVRTLPPAPDVADQATFNDRANAFVPELPPWGAEVNDLADWTGNRATSAEAAQVAAQASASAAASSASAAAAARDAAEDAEEQAGVFAAAAQAAAGVPALAGNAGAVLRVNAGGTGVAWEQVGVPVGAVFHIAADTAPPGYLRANGAAVSRTTYAALFAVIGTTYGAGNGSTTFNVPDLRDDFVRGSSAARPVGLRELAQLGAHSHGAGSITVSVAGNHNHGGLTGANGAHSHGPGLFQSGASFTVQTAGGANHAAGNSNTAPNHQHSIGLDGAHSHALSGNTASTGGDETRPRNVALLAVIKF